MNWLDIVIIVVLGILTFTGFRRGLIQTLVPLVGIVLAIFLAGRLQNTVADRLTFTDNESWAKIIAFAIVFIAVFCIVSLLAAIFRTVIKLTLFGWVDRLSGAAFGFATGWLICAAVIVLLARYAALPVDVPDIPTSGISQDVLHLNGIRESVYTTIDDSKLAEAQMDSFPIVLNLLPGDFEPVRDFFD